MQNGRGCRSMLHPPSVRYTSFDIASPLFLTQLTRDLFYTPPAPPLHLTATLAPCCRSPPPPRSTLHPIFFPLCKLSTPSPPLPPCACRVYECIPMHMHMQERVGREEALTEELKVADNDAKKVSA